MARCGWVNENDHVYCDYHDTEWGVPVRDDRALWELLCLESFQAGLSWITILRKRPAFQRAFAEFDPSQVAKFTQADVTRLMTDASIVRSRLKIEATIRSAQIYERMLASGESFCEFVWGGVDVMPIQNGWISYKDAPTSTPQSDALSKRLKSKGFMFCGPVICLAFMQASGMYNDHEVGCPRYAPIKALA